MRTVFLFLTCIAILVFLGGCSASNEYASRSVDYSNATLPKDAIQEVSSQGASKDVWDRKIIYTADLDVETKEMEALGRSIEGKLKELGGFVAEVSESRKVGDQRNSSWTLRIPVEKFSDFMQWIDSETLVVSKHVTSKDATEEFVDLQARLTNKRNSEKKLAAMLESRASELEEVLRVEKELDRMREEIERIEGRLRFLSERISLSTVVLKAHTRFEFSPPKLPSTTEKMAQTWQDSTTLLGEFLLALGLCIIGVAPWLPILLVLGFLIYKFFKSNLRASNASPKAE